MIDDGEKTEYEAVHAHLFMLMAMPFVQEFEQLMIVVTGREDGEVTVSLDGDDQRYVLYRQHGDEAKRKCYACADYLLNAIAEA